MATETTEIHVTDSHSGLDMSGFVQHIRDLTEAMRFVLESISRLNVTEAEIRNAIKIMRDLMTPSQPSAPYSGGG